MQFFQKYIFSKGKNEKIQNSKNAKSDVIQKRNSSKIKSDVHWVYESNFY